MNNYSITKKKIIIIILIIIFSLFLFNLLKFWIFYLNHPITNNSELNQTDNCNDECKYNQALNSKIYLESNCLKIENEDLKYKCLTEMKTKK